MPLLAHIIAALHHWAASSGVAVQAKAPDCTSCPPSPNLRREARKASSKRGLDGWDVMIYDEELPLSCNKDPYTVALGRAIVTQIVTWFAHYSGSSGDELEARRSGRPNVRRRPTRTRAICHLTLPHI